MVRWIAVAFEACPARRDDTAIFGRGAVCAGVRRLAAGRCGLLMRPLLGMVFLVIPLTGLYVLSAPGRFVPVVLTLGGIVFAVQTTMLVWPSDTAAILNEVAAQLFMLALCGVLSSRVIGPRTRHAKPHRRCGRGLGSRRPTGPVRKSSASGHLSEADFHRFVCTIH
jgi:hypothetical protein